MNNYPTNGLSMHAHRATRPGLSGSKILGDSKVLVFGVTNPWSLQPTVLGMVLWWLWSSQSCAPLYLGAMLTWSILLYWHPVQGPGRLWNKLWKELPIWDPILSMLNSELLPEDFRTFLQEFLCNLSFCCVNWISSEIISGLLRSSDSFPLNNKADFSSNSISWLSSNSWSASLTLFVNKSVEKEKHEFFPI